MNAFDRPVSTLAQQTQYTADAVNASGGRPRKPVTTQAVVAALKQDSFRAAKTQRLSVLSPGFQVSKLTDDTVRVYHFGLMNRDNSGLPKYAATLIAAGFDVEKTDSYLNVRKS